jgi:alkyl hydroperoxide reductase subunit AhpF
MLSERSLEIIKASENRLTKPVRLVMFTSETDCAACPDMLVLARAIKDHSKNIAIESYDLVMDRDKSQQYGIARVPSIVLQGGKGYSVTFSGRIEDGLLNILMDTIKSLSDTKQWFPDDVLRVLKKLAHDVSIRVFVDRDCPQCRFVAETAVALALESSLIAVNIIVAADFPELVRKNSIKELPTTIFGENLRMKGPVSESDFLEMIFEAEGIKPGPDRRCLVCGKPSQDIICANCKTRVHAEAIDHKTRNEKGMQQS